MPLQSGPQQCEVLQAVKPNANQQTSKQGKHLTVHRAAKAIALQHMALDLAVHCRHEELHIHLYSTMSREACLANNSDKSPPRITVE